MRRFLTGIALLAVAACGDSSTAPNATPFVGTFTLRTINGSPLPYVLLQSGANAITIVSDQLTIADGGTWTEIGTFRDTENGQTTTQSVADGGSWLRSGNSLVLTNSADGSLAYSGTFSTASLALSDDIPLNYVFTK